MALPNVLRVKQAFDRRRLQDACGTVVAGLQSLGLAPRLKPGARIAITAGSRGINNLVGVTRAAADTVKSIGGQPFVVPSMGSHGGATDEGQKNLLADLGISEATMGCPVVSSMAVEEIGRTGNGIPVYVDRNALQADGIIVINRVKPHTAFRGEIESGLCKMLAVGLGKHKGAQQMHRAGLGLALVEAARLILARAPVLAGIAVLENSLDETAEIQVVPPERFEETDRTLLKRAWQVLPRVPFDPLDVLVVDEMGKNISGTGMDNNVIGVGPRVGGKMEMGRPIVSTIVVLGLTPETHGNANGVGLADITTRRLVDSIDYKATYTNVLTTRLWSAGRLPVIMETDREAIEVAVGETQPAQVRLVRIKNTLHLE
ncbi:MAG TPA: DUF362 domain-containing protein, partial [Candidatus Methylomirabilis sp.]|nr:DUF362 domain-containing protein [Candidatus Methylomirabilis sp.]